jgi:sugar/nucleoside kinase (ribokinase family)
MKSLSNKEILITGTVAFDDIETPTGSSGKIIGGAGTYIALAASIFSKKISLVSVIGDDFLKEDIKMLQSKNINTDMIERIVGEKSFYWKGKYHSNLKIRDTLITELNALEKFNPIVNQSSKKAEIIVLGNLDPSVQLSVLDQLDNDYNFVILDTMNFWMDTALDQLNKAINKTDLIVINDEEAEQLTGEYNLEKASNRILKMGPKIVIIKKGDKGSEIFSEKESFHIPAYPIKSVIDPTGAGDCFAGGLAGYLSSQDQIDFNSIKKSMIFGSIVASYCVEDFGVVGVQNLDFSDIQKRTEIFKPYLL